MESLETIAAMLTHPGQRQLVIGTSAAMLGALKELWKGWREFYHDESFSSIRMYRGTQNPPDIGIRWTNNVHQAWSVFNHTSTVALGMISAYRHEPVNNMTAEFVVDTTVVTGSHFVGKMVMRGINNYFLRPCVYEPVRRKLQSYFAR